MQERKIEYSCGDARLVGRVAVPSELAGPRGPGVLVAPDWAGCGEAAHAHARALAELGYVGFALDMYGQGRTGSTNEERSALMAEVKADRRVLMERINAALTTLKQQPEVDPDRTGALGFCFGGLCVLDLARSGADVSGVVSMHGLLDRPDPALCKPIRAKVLVCHGYRDPMAPPEHMLGLCQELAAANCEFQLHAYGDAKHSFTNPLADNPVTGAYHEPTAKRALRSMRDFFADLFE